MKQSILFIFICFCLSACGQDNNVSDTIVIDKDVEIPIKTCVETNSKILGNSVNHVAFCKCLIPKFYADFKNDPEKLKLLKNGNWNEITNDK